MAPSPTWHHIYNNPPLSALPHLFFMLTKQTELQCAAEIGQVVFILLHFFYLTFADKFSGGGVKRGHTYQNYISFSDRIGNFLMYTFKKCGELYNALTLKHCLSPSCSDVETVGLSGAEMLSKADLCWAATDAKPRFIFFPKLPQSFQFTDGRMMSSCPFQRAVHFNPNFQFCCFEEFWPWGSFYHLLLLVNVPPDHSFCTVRFSAC